MATAYQNTPFGGNQVPTLVGQNKSPFQFNIATQTGSPLGTGPGFIINDTVNLVRIPNGSRLEDFYIDFAALDTSTGVVTSIGDNVASANGGADAGGFMTGLTLGRSSATGTVRAGGTGFVHGAIPWIYSIASANVPTVGIWLMLKITTAPTTTTTTGIIYGWISYSTLANTTMSSGTSTKPYL